VHRVAKQHTGHAMPCRAASYTHTHSTGGDNLCVLLVLPAAAHTGTLLSMRCLVTWRATGE
jgi:hypothetical protein